MNFFALLLAVIQPLWPEGKIPDYQDHQIGAMTDVSLKSDFKREEHRMPYIEWFDPPSAEKRNGTCLILISGGSYMNCCDVNLIRRWNEKFTKEGVQCVNFVYRTPWPKNLPKYMTAWQDGQRAVRLVRSQAKERGFDPEKIGAIAHSAGGHLALLLATSSQTPAYEKIDQLDDIPCHLNFAIPNSSGFVLTPQFRFGNLCASPGYDRIDPAFKFDAKTPPICMFHGGTDVVSPFGSTYIYRHLRMKKIPSEIHLFADRGHSFYSWNNEGKENSTAYDNWFLRACEFMKQIGFLGPLENEVSLLERYSNNSARKEHIKEDVWPKGKIPNCQTNQVMPYIEWHIPKELKTKAIQIIYSGGAYQYNSPDGFEVAPPRRFLNEKGMTVVTLRYRSPRPQNGFAKHTTAWQDLQRTIRIVRSKAPGMGLDPNNIGIMGFSAGGHLTLMGATSSRTRSYRDVDALDKIPCNVQWAIAIYPAYAISTNNEGGNTDASAIVSEFSFDIDTPPICFVHGDADTWSPMNSVKIWERLARMGIQCDLHTLATRKHCFQNKASPGTGSYTYLERIWEFMNHKGFNK